MGTVYFLPTSLPLKSTIHGSENRIQNCLFNFLVMQQPSTQDAIVTNAGFGWDSRAQKWNVILVVPMYIGFQGGPTSKFYPKESM